MHFLTIILRNLRQRPTRSALAVLGIIVTLSSAVALLALAQEFNGSLRQHYEGRGVEMVVVRAGVADRLTSNLPASLGPPIRQLGGVHDLAPVLIEVVSLQERALMTVPLQGWEAGSFLFHDLKMVEGRSFEAGERRAVLLGQVLAHNLQKKLGDRLTIEGAEFHVVGIFESFNIYENGSVLMPLDELQQFMDRPGQVTAFELRLEPVADKDALVKRLRQQIEELPYDDGKPPRTAALSVQEHIQTVLQLQLAQVFAWMTSVIAFAVGALGICNTMVMAVSERTHDIGILRALGWRRGRIISLIVVEACMLSLVGSVAGVETGWLLVKGLSVLPQASGLVQGHLTATVVVEGLLVGCGAGLFGSLYPALRAASLQPLLALRQEG